MHIQTCLTSPHCLCACPKSEAGYWLSCVLVCLMFFFRKLFLIDKTVSFINWIDSYLLCLGTLYLSRRYWFFQLLKDIRLPITGYNHFIWTLVYHCLIGNPFTYTSFHIEAVPILYEICEFYTVVFTNK